MSHNYVTVHVTGTSALDITVARTPQIPVTLSRSIAHNLEPKSRGQTPPRGESLANRVTFLGFQTVKSGRVGNGRGYDAKTGWLLSLLLYRFSEI